MILMENCESIGEECVEHLHLSFYVFPAVVSDCSIIPDGL